jgi:hypothetical protein
LAGPTHVHVITDKPNRISVIRVTGRREKDAPPLIDHLKTLEEPWLYDCILDLRRYEANLSAHHVAEINRRWKSFFKAQKFEASMAVISKDYTLLGYLKAQFATQHMPFLEAFDDFDAALDWIKSRRIPETRAAC